LGGPPTQPYVGLQFGERETIYFWAGATSSTPQFLSQDLGRKNPGDSWGRSFRRGLYQKTSAGRNSRSKKQKIRLHVANKRGGNRVEREMAVRIKQLKWNLG